MKRIVHLGILAAVWAGTASATPAPVPAATNAPLRVFSIGNSFSENAHRYLGAIAKSMGDRIGIGHAYMGGGSLRFHWDSAQSGKPAYRYKRGWISLGDYLETNRWDFVTIQQASRASHLEGSYEPAGNNLVAFVRQHAPEAEIVVHETWAYRGDRIRFMNWKLTEDELYAAVASTYRTFADRHGLRVIPGGTAFQLARQTPAWGDYTPTNKITQAPAQGRTLYDDGGYHANRNGSYLLGCVWYEFFFRKDVRASDYVPEGVSPEDAARLREIAHRVVTEGVVPGAQTKN